jgi:hypothetical protein
VTRHRFLAGYLFALAFAVFQIVWFWHATIEDAFISFRYARHWADHLGLVFNRGEWVEGYSNFLWTLLLGLALRLGGDPIATSKVLGLTATLSFDVILVLSARRLAGNTAGLAAALIAGCSTSLAFWSVAGLETSLAAALVALTLFLYPVMRQYEKPASTLHERIISGLYALPLAAATLTRAEMLGLAIVVVGLVLLRRKTRVVAWAILLYTAVIMPYWMWRWLAYGALLPNSLYAKAGLFESLRDAPAAFVMASVIYLGNWMLKWGVVWWLPLAWAARRRKVFLPLAVVIGYLTLVLLAGGGDWMPLQRLWLPALAPWVWLAVLGWNELRRQRRRLGLVLIALLVVAQFDVVALSGVTRDTRHLDRWWVNTMGTLAGFGLDNPVPLATTVLGRTGYYFEGRVLDAFGLADRYIARHGAPVVRMGRLDWAYVLAQQPAFILTNDQQTGLRQRVAKQPLYRWLPLSTPPDFPVMLLAADDYADAAAQAFKVSARPADDPAIDRIFEQRTRERQKHALGPLYTLICAEPTNVCNALWLVLKP